MWKYTVKVTHLLTKKEDYESVQKSMSAIADVLRKEFCFNRFDVMDFYKIPKGDHIFSSIDYANKLIDRMYDYADTNRIWIE